jgi:hypothetical protein
VRLGESVEEGAPGDPTGSGIWELWRELEASCPDAFRPNCVLGPRVTLGEALVDEYSRVCVASVIDRRWCSVPGSAIAPERSFLDLSEEVLRRATAAPSNTRRLYRCRRLRPDDIPLLHAWAQPERGRIWRRRRIPLDPSGFAALAYQSVLTHAILETTAGTPLGCLAVYDAEFPTGVAWLDVLANGRLIEDHPCAFAVIGSFFESTVADWPLRQLYFEMDDDCMLRFCSGDGKGFRVEARLRGHRYFEGRRHDILQCALGARA